MTTLYNTGIPTTTFSPDKAFEQVTLRVNWHGPVTWSIGDELVTSTGRRYQILHVSGKTFLCMVLPPEASVQSHHHRLT